jgi:transposase
MSAVVFDRPLPSFSTGLYTCPEAATKLALRHIARRHLALTAEITDLDRELDVLVAKAAPKLLQLVGVGTDVAGALLVAAGDNPDRLGNEGSFARLCGASPLPASSGKTNRHRLNRGGDRIANNALWRIVIVRMNCDERTRFYVERRTKEGLSKRDIIRCLKRYVAREVFSCLEGVDGL